MIIFLAFLTLTNHAGQKMLINEKIKKRNKRKIAESFDMQINQKLLILFLWIFNPIEEISFNSEAK